MTPRARKLFLYGVGAIGLLSYLYFACFFYFALTHRAALGGALMDTQEIQVRLFFTDRVKEDLRDAWHEHPGEYSACVEGTRAVTGERMEERYDELRLTLTRLEDVEAGRENYAPAPECETMGIIHKHPEGCNERLWLGDVEHAKAQFRNGVSLYLIQCEEDTLEVYTRDNLWEGRVISIA